MAVMTVVTAGQLHHNVMDTGTVNSVDSTG